MSSKRDAAFARLTDALRNSSAQALMVSHGVAAKVGLNMTDLECLDIIQMSGSATAGELARRTGLSTGAMTTAIDRLVRAGYAERRDDPKDRRKVLVTVRAERMQPLWWIYAPLQAGMERLYEDYSQDELQVIAAFMERAAAVSAEFTRSLRED